jgi:type IX secretion system PorP/SprF family membrane protein
MKIALYGLVLWGLTTTCIAQDPTFSMYNLNQFYYNPAYTGIHGGYGISATYKTLWPNVPGKVFPGPLSTYYAVFDAYLKAGNSYTAGAGVFAMQDIEGEGYLTTSTFGVSYAQHFPKIGGKGDALPRVQLSLGFKAYFSSISVDWDKLVYSDQLSIDQGIIGESATNRTGFGHKLTGDVDAGLLMKNNFLGKDKWYNEVGFAIAHLLTPSLSLTGSDNAASRLPRKYVGTYRSTVSLAANHLYIGPTILFENQGNYNELNTGLDVFINPNPDAKVVPLCISVMNRLAAQQGSGNTNSIIGSVMYKGVMGKQMQVVYNIGFAADFQYSGLYMQTKGAYELSVSAIIPPKGNNGFSKCPYETY